MLKLLVNQRPWRPFNPVDYSSSYFPERTLCNANTGHFQVDKVVKYV